MCSKKINKHYKIEIATWKVPAQTILKTSVILYVISAVNLSSCTPMDRVNKWQDLRNLPAPSLFSTKLELKDAQEIYAVFHLKRSHNTKIFLFIINIPIYNRNYSPKQLSEIITENTCQSLKRSTCIHLKYLSQIHIILKNKNYA